MTHQLIFEETWKQAISNVDMNFITEVYKKTQLPHKGEVQFTNIRTTYNHRDELLVTVLVQNAGDQDICFHDTLLSYYEEDAKVASHPFFTIPRLVVKTNTSMPWTFIFPNDSVTRKASFRNWKLVMENR